MDQKKTCILLALISLFLLLISPEQVQAVLFWTSLISAQFYKKVVEIQREILQLKR